MDNLSGLKKNDEIQWKMPGSLLMLTRTGNFLDWSGQEIGPGFMNWW